MDRHFLLFVSLHFLHLLHCCLSLPSRSYMSKNRNKQWSHFLHLNASVPLWRVHVNCLICNYNTSVIFNLFI